MKKHTLLLTILLIAVLTVFALTACGGDKNSVAGKTYDFESVTISGEDATELMNSMYAENYYTFNDDGTCLSVAKFSAELAEAGADDMEFEGTYEQEGDKVTAHFDGGAYLDIEFTVDGDQLIIDAEDGRQVYKAR